MDETSQFPYWARDLARRVERIEKLEPAVMAEKITALSEDVRMLKRAFYTFAFSVVGSAIVFAFTVFALLGRH
jgi:hypothetical protein